VQPAIEEAEYDPFSTSPVGSSLGGCGSLAPSLVAAVRGGPCSAPNLPPPLRPPAMAPPPAGSIQSVGGSMALGTFGAASVPIEVDAEQTQVSVKTLVEWDKLLVGEATRFFEESQPGRGRSPPRQVLVQAALSPEAVAPTAVAAAALAAGTGEPSSAVSGGAASVQASEAASAVVAAQAAPADAAAAAAAAPQTTVVEEVGPAGATPPISGDKAALWFYDKGTGEPEVAASTTSSSSSPASSEEEGKEEEEKEQEEERQQQQQQQQDGEEEASRKVLVAAAAATSSVAALAKQVNGRGRDVVAAPAAEAVAPMEVVAPTVEATVQPSRSEVDPEREVAPPPPVADLAQLLAAPEEENDDDEDEDVDFAAMQAALIRASEAAAEARVADAASSGIAAGTLPKEAEDAAPCEAVPAQPFNAAEGLSVWQ